MRRRRVLNDSFPFLFRIKNLSYNRKVVDIMTKTEDIKGKFDRLLASRDFAYGVFVNYECDGYSDKVDVERARKEYWKAENRYQKFLSSLGY